MDGLPFISILEGLLTGNVNTVKLPQEEGGVTVSLQTGIVKVSDGYEMSNYAFGEAHDGVFTMRNYTRLVSVQNIKP